MGDNVEPRKNWIDENVEFSLEDDYNIEMKKQQKEGLLWLEKQYQKP